MKKLEIKERFLDKHTGRMYAAGEIVEFEDKRADELLETKLVRPLNPPQGDLPVGGNKTTKKQG